MLPPRNLLGAALHLKWQHGHAGDAEAARTLAERVEGFTAEQYLRASELAAAMDGAAHDLAAAWFATRGQGPYPTVAELATRCPGFDDDDYAEAIRNNILWARK